jgi:hypothetical protein
MSTLDFDIVIPAMELLKMLDNYETVREHSFPQDGIDKVLLLRPANAKIWFVFHIIERGTNTASTFLTFREAEEAFEEEMAEYGSATA